MKQKNENKQKPKVTIQEVEMEADDKSDDKTDEKKPMLPKINEMEKDRGLFKTLKAELSRIQKESANSLVDKSGKLAKRQQEITKQLSVLIRKFEEESFIIIYEIMPKKIQSLDQMFREKDLFNASLKDLRQKIDTPAYQQGEEDQRNPKRERAEISCNKVIVALEDAIKHEILEMTEYMNTLSIWIQLNVPRIQDGNNFGVEVQSEIISVLEAAGDSGFEVLGGFTEYHLARGSLLTKVLKFPGIDDFRRAVVELDEKFYTKTALVVLDLRNTYTLLFDLINKNLSKIESPRGTEQMPFLY